MFDTPWIGVIFFLMVLAFAAFVAFAPDRLRSRGRVYSAPHKERDPLNELLVRNYLLIERFSEVAARHVARRDEYGMERWRDLPKLIYGCISRLGEAEGFAVELSKARDYRSGSMRGPFPDLTPGEAYKVTFDKLEALFRTYYASLEFPNPLTDRGAGAMSGEAFEREIAARFAKCGCQYEMTPPTGDQGADLIVRYKGRRIAVQVKRWSGAVGNRAVQEVVASQKIYGCGEAWVVTNSRFTQNAREVATAHGVVLVEGTELERLQPILDAAARPANGTSI
jgi:hypothetical protein